jgi:hypothetical protein
MVFNSNESNHKLIAESKATLTAAIPLNLNTFCHANTNLTTRVWNFPNQTFVSQVYCGTRELIAGAINCPWFLHMAWEAVLGNYY